MKAGSVFVSIFLLLMSFSSSAQKYEYVYRDKQDSSMNCYLKLIPKGEIKGVIIRDYSKLPDTAKKSPYKIQDLALANGFMTIYTVTSDFYPELYYDDAGPALLDEIVNEVLKAYVIPDDKIFIGGISASGTRALRYAQYCEQGKSKYGHKVKGVFVVDSPLDLERFYISSKHVIARNYENGNLWEANTIIKAFEEKLGGSPEEVPEKYVNASVYSYSHPKGGNAVHYTNLPIIIYHEPDIEWWIENRREGYYEFNSIDLAAFVIELKMRGSKNIQLITTTGKGYDGTGNRKPHSWTIVDEEQLMDWILNTANAY